MSKRSIVLGALLATLFLGADAFAQIGKVPGGWAGKKSRQPGSRGGGDTGSGAPDDTNLIQGGAQGLEVALGDVVKGTLRSLGTAKVRFTVTEGMRVELSIKTKGKRELLQGRLLYRAMEHSGFVNGDAGSLVVPGFDVVNAGEYIIELHSASAQELPFELTVGGSYAKELRRTLQLAPGVKSELRFPGAKDRVLERLQIRATETENRELLVALVDPECDALELEDVTERENPAALTISRVDLGTEGLYRLRIQELTNRPCAVEVVATFKNPKPRSKVHKLDGP